MDKFKLERFTHAQEPVYATALAELRGGRKRSHWMWFVFPQIAGLGHSSTAQHYALASLAEARAYLDHPLLGARLRACCAAVLALEGRTAHAIFGYPDELKFHSSLTLFARAASGSGAEQDPVLQACLDKYFGGAPDAATLARLPTPIARE
ncbi:MAG: DUF1810 domain-containing protein [Gammaproteobacteria bacterium]